MAGRKGRQECLPPSKECLQSYICKPANYQPPAMIELVFGRVVTLHPIFRVRVRQVFTCTQGSETLAGFHLHRIRDTRAPVPFFLKSGLRVYDP